MCTDQGDGKNHGQEGKQEPHGNTGRKQNRK